MQNNGVFDLEILNLPIISPMIVLCIFALFILCIGIFKKDLTKDFYVITTITGLIFAICFAYFYKGPENGFLGLIINDQISTISMILMLFVSIFFIAMNLCKFEFKDNIFEFYSLFLFMVVGYCFMVSSNNLIVIFIALETASIPLYTLIALHDSKKAIEAGIKYFVMGSVSAGFFALGIAFIYYSSSSFDIINISYFLSHHIAHKSPVLAYGIVLILISLCFKIAIMPFHGWLPGVYKGSSELMGGFLSIVPKVAAFIVAYRLITPFINYQISNIQFITIFLGVATMTLANMAALIQKDVKNMLAYSSISHSGLLLIVVAMASSDVMYTVLLYWTMFAFANTGAFCILWMNRSLLNDTHTIKDYQGIAKKHPIYASCMSIFMLSLAGIPPLSVFFGKMFSIITVISEQMFIVGIIIVINSALAVFYYLKIVVTMFLIEQEQEYEKIYFTNSSLMLKFLILASSILCVIPVFII